MYHILPYSYEKALRLGVKISPSRREGKKIDVFDWNGQYICSIGDINYQDYPTYIRTSGIEYAQIRRRAYRQRHNKEKKNPNYLGSPAYYANNILW